MAETTQRTETELKAMHDRNSPGWGDPVPAERTTDAGSTEIAETESNNPAPDEQEDEDDSVYFIPNPLVQRCMSAWRKTATEELIRLASRENPDTPEARNAAAREAGTVAYCNALPPLSNRQNVTDFIACVVHGIATGLIPGVRGTQLLYGAQVANSALPPRRKRA
jgi:hypothetical protein